MGLVDLPEPILVQILETVHPADIPVLHSTSSRLRSVLDARDYLWKQTFLQGVHFQEDPASYREAYLEQVSIEVFVAYVVKDLARYRYRDMVDLANRIAELWALGRRIIPALKVLQHNPDESVELVASAVESVFEMSAALSSTAPKPSEAVVKENLSSYIRLLACTLENDRQKKTINGKYLVDVSISTRELLAGLRRNITLHQRCSREPKKSAVLAVSVMVLALAIRMVT